MSTFSISNASLATNGQGTLSSKGVGSGLDVNSIISSLVAIEQVPLTGLQTKASAISSQISAVGQIQSLLATLQTSAATLADKASWTSMSVSSSQASAVSATASTTKPPSAGAFSVQVQSLAQGQSGVTSAVPSGSTLGAGTLKIQLGSYSDTSALPPTFSVGSSSAISINVEAGASLTSIAAQINSASAGVTATIVNGSNGQQLLLQSASTGAAQGFTMQATDAGTPVAGLTALSTLAFDPSQGAYGQGSSSIQYGANAQASINGVPVSSPSNTLSDAIAGMSFTLSQVTTSPAVISVSQNVTDLVGSISGFVSAYNAVNDLINTDTAYDAVSGTAGPLQGHAGTLGLQRTLARLIGTQMGGTAAVYRSLASLGITVGTGGDLAINVGKMGVALSSNPAEVQHFFAGDGKGTGLAGQLSSFLTQITGSNGTVTAALNGFNNQLSANSEAQKAVSARAATVQAQLSARYSALDARMASLNSLNNYVTQQIAQWNKSSSNGG